MPTTLKGGGEIESRLSMNPVLRLLHKLRR